MNRWHPSTWVLLGSVWGLGCIQPSAAQVIPDSTLAAPERSQVSGNPNFLINGGARRGGNLFHSFQQFSVPTGGSAFFNNAADVQNILTRVTGGTISNIDGVIRANGTANLFLINPSGIIFGQNASLNIGGSFVATTADALGFGNLGFFSASTPEAPSPLLTINPSALFFNQIAAAPIQNNSTAPAGTTPGGSDTIGLRVPNGKSLLLVGGNISMDGGRLNAFGGRVELGGLSGAGTVGLNVDGNNLSLSFPNSVERSDISLSNGAQVIVLAGNGGSIAVNARNLEMTGQSALTAGIETGVGSNTSKAGDISVNATGSINLSNKSQIANQVQSNANGQGGNVSISANTLRLEGGAQINTSIYGAGKGGSLRVDAQDVQLIGRTADGKFGSALFANALPNSIGDAGDITIKTNTLLVRDGAVVSSGTYSVGKGGSLSVDAQDVQIIGETADGQVASTLATSAEANSTGNAGDLTVRTNTLVVRDGAQIITATFGAGKGGTLRVDARDVQIIGRSVDSEYASTLTASTEASSTGDAGDLTIKTNTLVVRDGAGVSTGTSGVGKGGTLSVDAEDVQILGTSADNGYPSALVAGARNSTGAAGDLTIKTNTLLVRDGAQILTATFGAGKGGTLRVDAQDVQIIGENANGPGVSALAAAGARNSTGDAGDLTIKTNTLLVQDGALVTVRSDGTGTAGNMTLNADSIRLDNNGTLSANTQSPKIDPNREQATININSQDLILTGNSNIITNATGANVFGGNININADVLLGIQNSDITANSANFRGGNVRINTQGIFGLQFRDVASPQTSDITATGASRELSGNVQIIRPDVDPTTGLVQLPATVVDNSGLITQGCAANQGNSFAVTGRGGLPPLPEQQLDDNADWQDRRRLVAAQTNTGKNPSNQSSESRTNKTPTHPQYIEATSWQITPTGEVVLVANTSEPTMQNTLSSASCLSRKAVNSLK
jgi:filamentous hemagglutinin family protein